MVLVWCWCRRSWGLLLTSKTAITTTTTKSYNLWFTVGSDGMAIVSLLLGSTVWIRFLETNTIWAWCVSISLERVVLILASCHGCEVRCAVTLAKGRPDDFARSGILNDQPSHMASPQSSSTDPNRTLVAELIIVIFQTVYMHPYTWKIF